MQYFFTIGQKLMWPHLRVVSPSKRLCRLCRFRSMDSDWPTFWYLAGVFRDNFFQQFFIQPRWPICLPSIARMPIIPVWPARHFVTHQITSHWTDSIMKNLQKPYFEKAWPRTCRTLFLAKSIHSWILSDSLCSANRTQQQTAQYAQYNHV